MAIELLGCITFILPMTVKVTNLGAIAGLAFFLLCLAATMFYRLLFGLFSAMWKHLGGKIALIAISAVLGLLIIYAGVLTVLMLCAAGTPPQNPDAVIVLGCKVQPSGNPSLMLRQRINAAFEYLSENEEVLCIVSGGKGSDEPLSEAETMKNLLVEMGIDGNRIIIEDKSESTRQNIEYSLKLLEEQGKTVSEAAIVTDGFHQLRASLIVKESNVAPTAVSAETPLWLIAPYWVREWFALSHRFVFKS